MADPQGNGVVEVIGPDEQSYHFPAGTTKDQAVTYFKSKGIGMTHQTASSSFIPPPPSGTNDAMPQSNPAESGPNSTFGGMVRRGVDAAKGIYQTFIPQPGENLLTSTPLYKMGKGLYEGEKKLGSQVAEQGRQTKEALKVGDIPGAALRGAQTGVSALSTLNPFAVGPVSNINEKSAQGRTSEATGAGIFDLASLIAGMRSGNKPSPAKSVSRLSYASGAAPADLSHVLPDLQETVRQSGNPRTVGDVAKMVQDTNSRLDQTFNSALAQVGPQQIVPTDIADALEAKARTLPRTAAAEKQALLSAATDYRQPWTLQELNAERMYRNGLTRGFHGKSGSAQMAAMRSNADTMVDQTVTNTARDVLYDEMQRRVPGVDFQALKLKQSSMLDIMDSLEKRLDALDKAHAERAGEPLRAKMHPSLGAHPGGVSSYLHAGKLLPGSDPLANANLASSRAFAPSTLSLMRKGTLLSLPVSSLVTGKLPVVPPPPSDNSQ